MSKPNLAVAIDAGSHSIKGLVLELSKEAKVPRLLKKKFVKLPDSDDARAGNGLSQADQPSADSMSRFSSKLGEFILDLVKESGGSPERIVVGLGPNSVKLSVEEWKLKLKNSGKTISANDLCVYFHNLKRQNSSEGKEVFVLEVLINGYGTGFRAIKVSKDPELVFRVLTVELVPELATVIKEVQRMFGGLKTEFLSGLCSVQLALVKGLGVENGFLADIGGEYTVFTLLKNSSIVQVSVAPIGGRHFLRGVAKIFNIALEEAEDLVRQYSQGLLGKDHQEKIKGFFSEETSLWQKELTSAADFFYHFGPMPAQIFISGGGSNILEMSAAVRKGEWMRNLTHIDFPEIRVLGGESVFEGNTFDGLLLGPADFGLASLVFYLINNHTACV